MYYFACDICLASQCIYDILAAKILASALARFTHMQLVQLVFAWVQQAIPLNGLMYL